MNKYHLIMEKFWLVIAGVSFVFAVYKAGQIGISAASMFFLFPVIAAVLFGMRYFVRKKFEKYKDED